MNEPAKRDHSRSDPKSAGERALDALRQRNISPTPRSFEVFYALFDGGNRPLVDHIHGHEADGNLLTAGHIDALYREYMDGASDGATIAAGADDLADVAQGIVEQVAGNGDAIRAYGGALDHWRAHLNASSGTEDLLRAVAVLTVETERASARNRALEAQLSAAVGRVARLREDLSQVRQHAATDPLTGIANRRAFDLKLRRAIRDAAASTLR